MVEANHSFATHEDLFVKNESVDQIMPDSDEPNG